MQNNNSKHYELVVIGGGIGGYSAAIRGAQLGKKVALVNSGSLGGTCLNVGCIPTKALLHSAKLYQDILNAKEYGIDVSDISLSWERVQAKRSSVVSTLVMGIKKLIESNGIDFYDAKASFVDKHSLALGDEGSISADNFIIATGSVPFIPPIKGADLDGVIDSTGALELSELPKDMVIVGGGIIGLELAMTFSSFGVNVTVIELMDTLGGNMDEDISMVVQEVLKQDGVSIYTSAKVSKIEKNASSLEVFFEKDGLMQSESAEKVLIATGRKPYTEGLALDKIGIKTERGRVLVDDKLQTNVAGIYAVGDVCSRIMLAHVAEEQGIIAAQNAFAAKKESAHLDKVPSCVYTNPEIAWIGLNEKEAKEKGVAYRVGVFQMSGNAKSMIEGEADGTFVKLIFDDVYDELIGAHLFGPSATELIAELSLAMHLEATAEEIANTIHPHPTVSEVIKEASLASMNRAIHALKSK